MTSLEPTLLVRHLLVSRGTNIVYSAQFHAGVNILAGENSSGKSSVLSFLVYGLGADISQWSEHALLCDRVAVEVSLNGNIVTVSREISEQSRRPMDIFFGALEEALQAPTSAWQRFPYQTSGGKISFSQQLFGMLGLPELQTEVSGKITMHQLLRVHYSDQLSSVEHLFRDEAFDSPDLREAVGRLLFGAYDNEIYRNQLQLRDLRSRLDTLNGSLRNIYGLLSESTPLTREWVISQLNEIDTQLNAINAAIDEAEREPEADEKLTLEPLEAALKKLSDLQSMISKLDRQIESVELEFADSQIFITTLEEKLEAIEDSSQLADEIDQIKYTHCPSCFAELQKDQIEGSCHLCQLPFDEERLRARMLRQIASMRKQLQQSGDLQDDRQVELRNLSARRRMAFEEWRIASESVAKLQRRPSTVRQQQLRELYEKVGRLQQERLELQERLTLVGRLDQMSAEKQDIMASIALIEDTNERLLQTEATRLAKGVAAVAEETMWFLHHDLPRQDTFVDAQSVTFGFDKDRISVNGVSYFSASSKVYLKNSFLSAFLLASLRLGIFRHLRFLVLDTMEDKGMEPERSQNFQRLLVERSEATDVEHQIIFATAMLDPSLDAERYIIGRKSTHDDRTLAIRA